MCQVTNVLDEKGPTHLIAAKEIPVLTLCNVQKQDVHHFLL